MTVIAAVALGWWLDRTQLARQPPPTDDRRLELIATGQDNDKLFLFDAQTGAMWERYSSGKWSPYTDSLAESK